MEKMASEIKTLNKKGNDLCLIKLSKHTSNEWEDFAIVDNEVNF